MLTDVHTICGYVIAKYLYEQNIKSPSRAASILPQSNLLDKFMAQQSIRDSAITNQQFLKSIGTNWRTQRRNIVLYNGTITSLLKNLISPISWIRVVKNLFANMSFEDKYLLCGMILGNLPDVDVLLTPLFGGFHHFHRTITHSVYGNAIIIPLAGYVMYKVLGLKGLAALKHCIRFAFMCIASHLVTDYITNYGTGLFAPFSSRTYTFGVVTVCDFTTVLYFYGMLTASRHNWFKQSNVMFYGLIIFVLLMFWKRACLCEAYSKQFHFMEKQRRARCKIWLQPNNFRNGTFSVMKYDPKTDYAQELKSVKVSSILSLAHYIAEVLRVKSSDMRRVKMSETLGMLQGMCAPREFFPSLQRTNHDLLKKIVKLSLPTFSFIGIYHLVYLILFIRRTILVKT